MIIRTIDFYETYIKKLIILKNEAIASGKSTEKLDEDIIRNQKSLKELIEFNDGFDETNVA